MVKINRTTKQQYEEQLALLPYNTRNMRILKSLKGIDRASKGVGSAIMCSSVLPVCQAFHRSNLVLVQRSAKKTIKHQHALKVYTESYEIKDVKIDRTTKKQYEEQLALLPYNTRNMRILKSLKGIDRASKGVGSAIMCISVLPVCQAFHRSNLVLVQRSAKKTIKLEHAKAVYTEAYEIKDI